jgi:hypothetical protein
VFRHAGSRMIISRTWFLSLAVFWIVIVTAQYFFLYKKYEALGVCQEQHHKVDALAAQVDKTQAQINGLKKRD